MADCEQFVKGNATVHPLLTRRYTSNKSDPLIFFLDFELIIN